MVARNFTVLTVQRSRFGDGKPSLPSMWSSCS